MLQVRPPIPSDVTGWQQLWADYNAFYGRHGETALPADVVETTWRRLTDPSEPVCGLLAERDDQLVGLAHVVFHRNLIQVRDTCYLQDLFTAPQARGAGVARALIDGVTALCKSRAVDDIYWHTQAENAAARRLYDRLARDTGFIVYRMGPGLPG